LSPAHFRCLFAAPGIHPGSDWNLRFDDGSINQVGVENRRLKPNRHDHRVKRAARCDLQPKRHAARALSNTSLTIVGDS
jgi:hypothetical protein